MHIAIVGCGQLSRMMALAAIPMGFTFSFVADEGEDTRCVDFLGKVVKWVPGSSIAELYEALGRPAKITVEKEQVDIALVEALQAHCPVHPNPVAFSACQHRYREKQLLDQLGIPCAPYIYGMPSDDAAKKIPLPVVVKSCREGYDGKNQWVLRTPEDVTAFDDIAEEDAYIVEQMIPFEKEVSQVSVRSEDGEIRHYPLTENTHENGILRQSVSPAVGASETLTRAAQDYMTRIMEELNYVGTMAMETFVMGDKLLVNELAPRVHNSGHWTQSGAMTCQFENHMRAVSGLPLGSTGACGVAGMVNLIGTEAAPLASLEPNTKVHWYDKGVRPGRKLGHINVVAGNYDELFQQLEAIKSSVDTYRTS
ncbi:MAG: 5-(carboxyamino)imidazole ribonucleotide synthase [Cellvibrionaceae bacterium]